MGKGRSQDESRSFMPCILGCARSVPEPGQNKHLPLPKKNRAGLEITRCFESALKELSARYVFESVKSTG
jgi:hypothetical protein